MQMHDDCNRAHEQHCGEHKEASRETVLNPAAKASNQTTLRVAGMDCAEEVDAIERVLKPLPGVHEVRVNLMGGKVVVSHDRSVMPTQIIQAIGGAGLKAIPDNTDLTETPADAQRSRLISVAVSGVLTGVGLVLHWSKLGPPPLNIGAFAAAIITGSWFILPKAACALRRFALDMNVLMTLAVIGAVAIGEWSEGAAVTFLFAVSELLESFSVARARRAIQSLMELSPETAFLKQGDSFQEVPVEQVKIGDLVAVKSGSRVPLDGEVLAGASAVNQAPITGESMPVEKQIGDAVFAGTINGEGSLEVRVTKLRADTTLAKIIHLVEEAQLQKAPSQRFVDVFAKYYTPTVMLMALVVFLGPPLAVGGAWAVWTYRALVLLVIACPCALVISTPVSIVSGLTAMARRGVLIKGGAFLETIGMLRALAVDKTGTITDGRPCVVKVVSMNDTPEGELVRIAAAIDIHSTHPMAQAVVEYARQRNIEIPRGKNYQGRTGRGAEAELDGHHYFVGNHRFAHELAVCSKSVEEKLSEIEANAQSVVVVGHMPHADCPGEVLGILAVGDAIRSNAAIAIQALHAARVEKVVMLSGDNQRTVDAIAQQVGIDDARGGLLPEDKVERVRELMARYKHVGMIGDGVNDAPAMAVASVGIAMGAAGTDTAIETADIALMRDDLSQVAWAIRIGRRMVRVIQSNIVFAVGVKVIFLALALTGHTSLWLAILADTGATLLVIGNALRLLSSERRVKVAEKPIE